MFFCLDAFNFELFFLLFLRALLVTKVFALLVKYVTKKSIKNLWLAISEINTDHTKDLQVVSRDFVYLVRLVIWKIIKNGRKMKKKINFFHCSFQVCHKEIDTRSSARHLPLVVCRNNSSSRSSNNNNGTNHQHATFSTIGFILWVRS